MEGVNEDLFLKSLDDSITPEEQATLATALKSDRQFKRNVDQFEKLRAKLLRTEADSFGPFFAERIINRIKSVKKEIDYQIFFFFKKYQLAAIGVVVALVVLNIVLSDNLTVKSVLGFEEQADDIVTIDLYSNITN